MEKVDTLIIGAGVIGLALAREFAAAGQQVIVLEQHPSFGQETSSRNSEVVHGGMYYPTDSVKAKLCVRGNALVGDFCLKHNVPYQKTGKLIIASSLEEIPLIENLYTQGQTNGAVGLQLLNRDEINRREPYIRAKGALYSPSTAILDTHNFMQTLEKLASQAEAIFAYGCRVTGITYTGGNYTLSFIDTDGEEEQLKAARLINSAGLYADKIAALAGIDIQAAGYKLYYCKGEYYNVQGLKRGLTNHLIYPVPGRDYLGIHTVLDLQGQLKLGPNAYYVDKIDYSLDGRHKDEFYDAVHRFLPLLQKENMIPDMAGIRPKLQGPGEGFRDFVICHEAERGLPGLVNLIGMESPGLTSSLAIAAHVRSLL